MISMKFAAAALLAVVLVFSISLIFTLQNLDKGLPEPPGHTSFFEANISHTEVNLAEYLNRQCFPAVGINIRSEKAGALEIWREPSKLEYFMPPFEANEWLPDFAVMRVELAIREFIRKTQSGFDKKYGSRELVYAAPVKGEKEYRFVIAPPDIPMFGPFALNTTENACGKVNPLISNDEGWQWTFNHTVKIISGALKGEKELSVRYKW